LEEKRLLEFGEVFEREFVGQGVDESRGIEETLGKGSALLSI